MLMSGLPGTLYIVFRGGADKVSAGMPAEAEHATLSIYRRHGRAVMQQPPCALSIATYRVFPPLDSAMDAPLLAARP